MSIMKGKVYLIIGDPGTGKSTLRQQLANNDFFRGNGILVQDISPDGEGSWTKGKSKEDVREKRERYHPYSKEYYEGAKKAVVEAKSFLRLFIADMGGKPNPNNIGVSDKEDLLENADGYIYLKKEGSKWESFLKPGKEKIVFDMPTERLSNKDLKQIVNELEEIFSKNIEDEKIYERRLESMMIHKNYIPININNYYVGQENFDIKALADIIALETIKGKKYCFYGKGPVLLTARLLRDLNEFVIFDPKLKDPFVELPIEKRFRSKKLDVDYSNSGVIKINLERFIYPHEIPLLEFSKISNKEASYINCGGAVWMQMDIFLQLKNVVSKRGLYSKREDRVFWIDD